MKSAFIRSIVVLSVCAILPACEETRKALGYDKAPPDEFQVVQRAPLSVPPDFALRPPAPGLVRPQEGTTRDQAKSALMGPIKSLAISSVGRDTSDVALLKRAGVETSQKDIRDLVDKETLAQAQADKSFTDKIVFWQDPQKPGSGEQVDPEDEGQRLRENQALGRGVTDGETPRIEKSRRGMLEGLFDWVPEMKF